jgi:hypothetical protein
LTNNNSEQQKTATLDDIADALKKNNELLEEVATWLRVSGYDKVKNLLNSALDSPEKKTVYHQSDGKGSKEVGELADIDFSTVTRYWKAWQKIGLMKSISVKGGQRYIRNFDLKDFGIEVSRITTKQLSTTSPQEQTAVAPIQNQVETGK